MATVLFLVRKTAALFTRSLSERLTKTSYCRYVATKELLMTVGLPGERKY